MIRECSSLSPSLPLMLSVSARYASAKHVPRGLEKMIEARDDDVMDERECQA